RPRRDRRAPAGGRHRGGQPGGHGPPDRRGRAAAQGVARRPLPQRLPQEPADVGGEAHRVV
ncbi:MAG: L-aspartate oxidase, partial [uncultured Solirubrobacteraceae bacterium]